MGTPGGTNGEMGKGTNRAMGKWSSWAMKQWIFISLQWGNGAWAKDQWRQWEQLKKWFIPTTVTRQIGLRFFSEKRLNGAMGKEPMGQWGNGSVGQ